MNQLPENSLGTYDVTIVTSYLIGLIIPKNDNVMNIKNTYECKIKFYVEAKSNVVHFRPK